MKSSKGAPPLRGVGHTGSHPPPPTNTALQFLEKAGEEVRGAKDRGRATAGRRGERLGELQRSVPFPDHRALVPPRRVFKNTVPPTHPPSLLFKLTSGAAGVEVMG